MNRRARAWKWCRRGLLGSAALLMLTIIAIASAVRFWDFPLEELSIERGGPLIMTDRHGEILRKSPSPSGHPGREGWVPLAEIPPLLVSSFVVSEDERFFEHGGVDARGIVRAAFLNVREGRLAYGGSTITMQLVRMIRWPRARRTFGRKISEAVLAMRLERALSKEEILEHYLNRAYFGGGAHGVEAAARLYFDKPARALSEGEATFLAVLPRAPSAYDPHRHPGAALARREHVFSLLKDAGIMSVEAIELARQTTPTPGKHHPSWKARHFTEHVASELPSEVRRAGGTLRTTLDLRLQETLERLVSEHVAEHRGANLDQAGMVVIDSGSGEVLAMVGSAGWKTSGGEINFATRRRHPGSALKPFVYALAIESGDTPATIAFDVADVPSAYKVTRLTQKERGPVRYREALAGSYNLAAVHTLERIGVGALMSTLRRAGVGELDGDAESYGLRLALGSAKVRLIDLANAYRFLVRDGRVTAHRSVIELDHSRGDGWRPATGPGEPLVSPQTAWMVMDMLSDPGARRPAFGDELPIDLPYPVAVKTGTSRGFADTVTIAVTEQVTVAAWAGNGKGEPTQGLIAMEASAPLVRAGLLAAGRGDALSLPAKPPSIATAEVCPISGMRRGPRCPHGHSEFFAANARPKTMCSWHRAGGVIEFPAVLAAWARRTRERGGRSASR